MYSTSNIITSFHDVVSGYHFENVLVLGRLKDTCLKHLFDMFQGKGNDSKTAIFEGDLDKGVYSKNRFFRIGCCKYGKSAFLELKTKHSFKDTLCSHIDDKSVFIDVPETEIIKKTKAPRRTNFEIAILDNIVELLKNKYEDVTSVFCREQSKQNSYYFKTRGERVCPHGYTHCEDNFIVSHDVHKGELVYVCLSSECSPQKTVMAKTNGIEIVEDDYLEELGVKSDLEAAQKVIELYPHWVSCDQVLFVFDKRTGMWSDKSNVHFSVLSELEEHLHLLTWNEKNMEWKRNTKSYGNDSVLAKNMMPFLHSMCIDNNWILKNATTSLGKLLFKNGYFDLTTAVYMFHKEFDPVITCGHGL